MSAADRSRVNAAMTRVEIYTLPLCPYCWRAKRLLRRKGIAFREINLMRAPERRAEMEARANGRRSVPQIFLGERHLGGADDLSLLDATGELDRLLAEAGVGA